MTDLLATGSAGKKASNGILLVYMVKAFLQVLGSTWSITAM